MFLRHVIPRVLAANVVAAVIVYLYLALVSAPDSAIEENAVLEIASVGVYVAVAALSVFE